MVADVLASNALLLRDLSCGMRDGVELLADAHGVNPDESRPVVLIRTPYGKGDDAGEMQTRNPHIAIEALLGAGYPVVIQDTRGTGRSGGVYRKYVHEREDGEDTLTWLAAQPWCDGRVAMIGASQVGATAMLAATSGHAALRGVVTFVTAGSHYEGAEYEGGAFQLFRTLGGNLGVARGKLERAETAGADVTAEWAALDAVGEPMSACRIVPTAELPRRVPHLDDYAAWLAHPDGADAHHRETSLVDNADRIRVPVVHITGWYDVHLKGTLSTYTRLVELGHAPQRLVLTPRDHGIAERRTVGDVTFGPGLDAVDLGDVQVAAMRDFFGEHGSAEPHARVFVMGRDEWRDEDEWPPSRAVPTRYHLRSGGRLTLEPPTPGEVPDRYDYDPADPTPTIDGRTLLGPGLMGPRDHRELDGRADVIRYLTEPLEADLEVTGALTVRLAVSTTAADTDFTAALVDVHPDGRMMGIADGILRLRYALGPDRQVLATPGEVREIDIDLVATSNVFLAGHRIGVEISSSNFPRFDRNPNSGGVVAETGADEFVVATQTVFHDALRPSYLELPVIDAG